MALCHCSNSCLDLKSCFTSYSCPLPPLRLYQQQCILCHLILLLNILVIAVASIITTITEPPPHGDPEPYHTSTLSGEGWLLELLTGHPEYICNKLSMYADSFDHLIVYLRESGQLDLRLVSLEEQAAIFLYMCVTGLTVTHVAERFQRSNDTISWYIVQYIVMF